MCAVSVRIIHEDKNGIPTLKLCQIGWIWLAFRYHNANSSRVQVPVLSNIALRQFPTLCWVLPTIVAISVFVSPSATRGIIRFSFGVKLIKIGFLSSQNKEPGFENRCSGAVSQAQNIQSQLVNFRGRNDNYTRAVAYRQRDKTTGGQYVCSIGDTCAPTFEHSS